MAALQPRGPGHLFVVYGDSCSGIAGALHERTFASVNAVLRRLSPAPEFILFLGDEISGLTPDADALRAQWRHWLDHEMSWLDQPMWHVTGNHTTYDTMSEGVFREMLPHLPRNGPPGQDGLSYWVRRGDLLLIFVHTLWTGLGGEGHVETEWLRQVLREHSDARFKLVIGHHPVHPVNGFSGAYQREIGPEHASTFWDTLVQGGVVAYFCSHILAYDAQVHRGVLQVCTAGAGTAHRMPEGIEYLHLIQATLDGQGLRCQVIDTDGRVRERLSWPLAIPAADLKLSGSEIAAPITGQRENRVVAFRFRGRTAGDADGTEQTLLSAFYVDVQPELWIGLRGVDRRLTVIMGPERNRSPHYWLGPVFPADVAFDFRLVIDTGMGPGGIMCDAAGATLSSLSAASPWGAERLSWPDRWSIGHARGGIDDRPFRGPSLTVSVAES